MSIEVNSYKFNRTVSNPFLDGNKRTGIGAALLFLAYNDVALTTNYEELWHITMRIAQSKISEEEVALFFKTCDELFKKYY